MKKFFLIFAICLMVPIVSLAADYVIGEGDKLGIDVWGVKELSFSVIVRPDGKITVPGLGDVSASGQTATGLQRSLTSRLKELVKNPIVTVTVTEITNSKAYIFGGGVSSGVFDLNRRTTLLQLLCSVGNTTSGDNRGQGGSGGVVSKVPDFKHAYVLRNGKKIKENFYRLFVTGDLRDDMIIESNDAIFIPPLMERNIYILGAVNTPKAIEYREGMTVMEGILEAGGFSKFANQNDVIIRRKEGTRDVNLQVKAKKLIQSGDLEQNVALRVGDYVVVKESMF